MIPAVLVIVILLSAWAAYKGYSHQREAGRRRPRQQMQFRCPKCGHEFGMTPREFANEAAKENPDGKRPVGLANCPQCGAKACAHRMLLCPHCKKHYLPDPASRWPVCSHCRKEYRATPSEQRRSRDE